MVDPTPASSAGGLNDPLEHHVGSVPVSMAFRRTTLRLKDEPNQARFERRGLGRLGFHADAGLVVPLIFRGQGHGVLMIASLRSLVTGLRPMALDAPRSPPSSPSTAAAASARPDPTHDVRVTK